MIVVPGLLVVIQDDRRIPVELACLIYPHVAFAPRIPAVTKAGLMSKQLADLVPWSEKPQHLKNRK